MSKRSQGELLKLKKQARNLLSQGCSTIEITTKLGISVRTLNRWLEDLNPSEKLSRKIATPRLHLEPSEVEGEGEGEDIEDPQPQLPTPQPQLAPVLRLVQPQEPQEPKQMPSIGEIRCRITNIAMKAMARLDYLLDDPDISHMTLLKAIQLAGDWASYSKGTATNINLAISTVENVGFKVVDPSIKAENSDTKKGLTEEAVNQIKQKLLGIPADHSEFLDDDFTDDDGSD